MTAMKSWLALALNAALSFSLLAVCPSALASDLEQHLHDQYQGKKFVLRGFYSGDHLIYDASGTLTAGGKAGDWMSDGFVEIREIRASHHHLVLKAERMLVIQFEGKEFEFLRERIGESDKHPVEIDVNLDLRNSSQEQAETALSEIFLTATDSLETSVPDYWKPCVHAAAGGRSDFRFSSDLRAIPGTAVAEPSPAGDSGVSEAVTCNSRAHGTGRSHPTAIFQPNPEFSERARKEKKQGVVTLSLVVNQYGLPENVRVMRPVGYGLDEKAISCVRQWRFKPAEKNGEPVATEIAVQLDFHLY